MRPGRLAWLDRPEPRLSSGEDVLVRPFVASRCDGDVLPIHHRVSRAMELGLRTGLIDASVGHICGPRPFEAPFPIGHEAVAEVVAVGDRVEGLGPGHRVVVPWAISCGRCRRCRQGLTSKCATVAEGRTLSAYGFGASCGPFGGLVADLVRVPYADMLVPLPTGLDPIRVVAAADNLADAWRCVVPQLARRPGADVLVVGGGARSIGLYSAGLAAHHGAASVDFLHEDERSLQIAEQLGARAVPRGRRFPTVRKHYDIVVEASSSSGGLRHALRSTAPGGECTAVGYYVRTRTGMPLMHMYATDITLHLGVSHPRAVLPELLAWVHEQNFPAELVAPRVDDFDDAPNAYAAHATKVVLARDPIS